MSYTCIYGNKNGIVAASDSRITYRFGIHMDHRKKVHISEEQGRVWVTSGLIRWHWKDYAWLAGRILRRPGKVEEKIQEIGELTVPLTFKRFVKSKKTCIFHIIIGQREETGFTVYDVKATNGMFTVIRRELPAFAEGGFNVKRFPKVDRMMMADFTLDRLKELAERRVAAAIAADKAEKKKNRRYRATIGGEICTEVLMPLKK